MKQVNRYLAVAIIVGFATSCGGVEESKEYKDVESRIEKLQADIATAKEEKTKLSEGIDKKATERREEISKAKSATANAKAQREGAFKAVGNALLNDVVRARAIQELVVPGCIEQTRLLREAEGKFDSTDEQFEYVTSKSSDSGGYWVSAAMYESGDPEAFKKMEDEVPWDSCNQAGNREFYKTCDNVDKLVLKKDPDRFKGKCLTGTVRIAQMDSGTGSCAFQGYIGGGYDVRTQFGMTLSTLTHSTFKDCEWTDRLKENMTITFWAYGLGAYSYETTSGGNQTIPAFKLVIFRG